MVFRILCLCLLCFCSLRDAHAQRIRGMLNRYPHNAGVRFQANFNYFHLARNYPLVDGWFSSFVVGGFYRHYTPSSGLDIGLNLNYKGSDGFSLPVVMQDFRQGQQTSHLGIEMDFRVGPRFGPVNPRIGYILGVRPRTSGWAEPDTFRVNQVYFLLPFSCSVDLPTNYGSVGIGLSYLIGINNVLHNPGTVRNSLYDGGRQRALCFDLTTTFGW